MAGNRHEGVGHEAAVGIGVGRDESHGGGHQVQHPAHGLQQLVAGLFFRPAVEDIVARVVKQGNVNVHATAGQFWIGLGHEGRLHAVLTGGGANGALEQHTVVRRLQRVLHVQQVDFELAGGVFGGNRAGGDADGAAVRHHVVEHPFKGFDSIHAIDLGRAVAQVGQRRNGRLGFVAGKTLAIQQIELQLEGDNRAQAQLGKLAHHPLEHVARLKEKRLARFFLEGQHQLAAVAVGPGNGGQTAGNAPGENVRIAIGHAPPQGVVGVALGVQQEGRGAESN